MYHYSEEFEPIFTEFQKMYTSTAARNLRSSESIIEYGQEIFIRKLDSNIEAPECERSELEYSNRAYNSRVEAYESTP